MPADIASEVLRTFTKDSVGIVEFSESEDYCGKQLYPLQRVLLKLIFLEEMSGEEEDLLSWMISGGRGDVDISPGIRERRDYCRERNYPHFSEIDLVGGRRASKGHITSLATTRKVYDIWQLPDPGAFFGIDIDKEIYFANVASSLKVAKERQFADNYSAITRCKPLIPNIPPGKALEESISIKTSSDERNIRRMKELGMKVSKDFNKLKIQPFAANASTVRGLAMAVCVLDEMAHMLPGESRSSAAEVYGALEPSLKQFRQNTLVFCNSSPYTKVGQFYEQFLLSMRAQGSSEGEWYPMRFAIRWASWALYDFWWRDLKWLGSIQVPKWIQPIMVSPDWPDQMDPTDDRSKLTESDKEARQGEKLTEQANKEKYRVEYRSHWAEVTDAYLDPLAIDRAFSYVLPNGEPLAMTQGGRGYVYDYIMHCDPSSTTAGFGYACAHVEEYPDETGMWPGGVARHVVFDRVWRWDPANFPEHTINYIKVRQDLEKQIMLYRPSQISFDQYNSISLSQELRNYIQRGNMVTRVQIDTANAKLNWDRWECLKTAINLGLVHVPKDCRDPVYDADYSEWSSNELKFLQMKTSAQIPRVDKQDSGPVTTKDVADCICIVVYKFLASYLGNFLQDYASSAKIQGGAMGGFQIGGRNPGGPMSQENASISKLEEFYSNRSSNTPMRTRTGYRPSRRR